MGDLCGTVAPHPVLGHKCQLGRACFANKLPTFALAETNARSVPLWPVCCSDAPPCASAICRHSMSPSPRPPVRLLRLLSTRKKGSKSRSRASGATPGPRSATRSPTHLQTRRQNRQGLTRGVPSHVAQQIGHDRDALVVCDGSPPRRDKVTGRSPRSTRPSASVSRSSASRGAGQGQHTLIESRLQEPSRGHRPREARLARPPARGAPSSRIISA